nr:MAG TPA: hypothetical protein [Caudoviricetes sp.]
MRHNWDKHNHQFLIHDFAQQQNCENSFQL